jgi:hypothetical protein
MNILASLLFCGDLALGFLMPFAYARHGLPRACKQL